MPPNDDTEDEEIWTAKIIMPIGAKILTAGNQGAGAYIWALVDKNHLHSTETRKFRIYPTGLQEFDDYNLVYISTIFFKDAKYVFHVFEDILRA